MLPLKEKRERTTCNKSQAAQQETREKGVPITFTLSPVPFVIISSFYLPVNFQFSLLRILRC